MLFFSEPFLRRTAILLLFLIVSHPVSAQTLPTSLNIIVVQGEGATNNIRRQGQDPIVQVEDENHKPVSGAVVVFTLPTEGATGDFGGRKTLIVNTDRQGRAVGKSLKMNALPGKVPIHVSASYRGLAVRAIINQVSVVPPGEKAGSASSGGHGVLIGVLLAVGAAAGGGAYYATRKTKDAAPPAVVTPPGPTPIGITPGTGTIVGGR